MRTETKMSIDEAIEYLVVDFEDRLDRDEHAEQQLEDYRAELETEPEIIASEWQKRFDQPAEFVIADDGDNVIVLN